MSQTGGFQVPTCQCGHVRGDHASVRVPSAFAAPGGTCFRCDCTAFTDRAYLDRDHVDVDRDRLAELGETPVGRVVHTTNRLRGEAA